MERLILLFSLFPLLANGQIKKDCERAMPFSKIQIYDGIIATLERGEENHLCPGTDTNLEDFTITLSEGKLKIRKVPGKKYDKSPKIRIVYKNLNQIEGFGQADIDTRNILKGDSLIVILRSGAKLYADFDVKYLNLEASEGSLIKAKGYAIEQIVNISVKATFSGFELEGEHGTVKSTTGGTAKVNLEKKIKAHATTGGQIRFKGTPELDSKTSIGGKIQSDTGEE